jgi:hypothetical protein
MANYNCLNDFLQNDSLLRLNINAIIIGTGKFTKIFKVAIYKV